jgi:N-acetylglucosaminyldiphosphoundecaprenol N-acetyl-beta-D-mannosaminyltransferase
MVTSQGHDESAWVVGEHLIGPVRLVASTPDGAARGVGELVSRQLIPARHIHLVNAYTIALMDEDPQYARIFGRRALNLPDGKPLEWLSRILRHRPPLQQIRGPKLFVDCLGLESGVRHFFLGSTPDVLERMTTEIERRCPGAEIAGHDSPPFAPPNADEYRRRDELIARSGANLVWVALGTPKQDYEAERLATGLNITAIAVGAAFDFAAGSLREAPPWLSRLGLEWLFRFAAEPRRLWRRYIFGNARFLKIAARGCRNSLRHPRATTEQLAVRE